MKNTYIYNEKQGRLTDEYGYTPENNLNIILCKNCGYNKNDGLQTTCARCKSLLISVSSKSEFPPNNCIQFQKIRTPSGIITETIYMTKDKKIPYIYMDLDTGKYYEVIKSNNIWTRGRWIEYED